MSSVQLPTGLPPAVGTLSSNYLVGSRGERYKEIAAIAETSGTLYSAFNAINPFGYWSDASARNLATELIALEKSVEAQEKAFYTNLDSKNKEATQTAYTELAKAADALWQRVYATQVIAVEDGDVELTAAEAPVYPIEVAQAALKNAQATAYEESSKGFLTVFFAIRETIKAGARADEETSAKGAICDVQIYKPVCEKVQAILSQNSETIRTHLTQSRELQSKLVEWHKPRTKG